MRHVLIRYGVFQQVQTAPPDTSLLRELPTHVSIFQPRHVLQLLNANAQLQHAQLRYVTSQLQHAQLRYVTSQPQHELQLRYVISLLQHEQPQLQHVISQPQHEPQLLVSTFLTQHEPLLLLVFTFQLLLQLLYEDVLALLRDDDVFSLPQLLSPI